MAPGDEDDLDEQLAELDAVVEERERVAREEGFERYEEAKARASMASPVRVGLIVVGVAAVTFGVWLAIRSITTDDEKEAKGPIADVPTGQSTTTTTADSGPSPSPTTDMTETSTVEPGPLLDPGVLEDLQETLDRLFGPGAPSVEEDVIPRSDEIDLDPPYGGWKPVGVPLPDEMGPGFVTLFVPSGLDLPDQFAPGGFDGTDGFSPVDDVLLVGGFHAAMTSDFSWQLAVGIRDMEGPYSAPGDNPIDAIGQAELSRFGYADVKDGSVVKLQGYDPVAQAAVDLGDAWALVDGRTVVIGLPREIVPSATKLMVQLFGRKGTTSDSPITLMVTPYILMD